MIERLKEFMETDFGFLSSFILYALDFIARIFFGLKILKWIFTKFELNTVKGILLLSSYLIIGLIIPVSIFIFTPWHGWIPIILKIIGAYSLFNFFGLIYVWVTMEKMFKKNNIE